ncbi:MAG: hypothetical protein ABOJ95_000148 [Wolbachia endosymbiont of Armadillidium vulgare]
MENKISNREFNPNKNIELIDFNELDLREYEFSFHLQPDKEIELSQCSKYTVSRYFRDLYSIPESKRLSFGVEIDSMRIFMLLALKSPMIYFDFDILPKENEKLGEIQAKQGFLVAENDETGHDYDGIPNIENAIIAVSDTGRVKIMEVYNEMKYRFQKHYPMLRSSLHHIYTMMENMISRTPLDEKPSISLSDCKNYDEYRDRFFKVKRSIIQRAFGFKINGGKVDIQYDNSWMKNKNELYTKEEIARIDGDASVATSIQVKSVSSCEHMYRS